MNVTLFIIVMTISSIGMIAFVLCNMRKLPVVKAGKADELHPRLKYTFGKMPSIVKVNGVSVDLNDDVEMLVCGNSMKDYNIHDGQRIYVKEYKEDSEKLNIKTHPVLVFRITQKLVEEDADFKLRKFVGYLDGQPDWNIVYERYKNRIHIDKDIFIAQCEEKYNKTTDREHLVLSETYSEKKKVILYSMHAAKTIYGKVEYAM